MSTIEHEIMVDRTDQGHRAFCACGYRGRLRIDDEHALFDAADHRVRHLCRRLRRHAAYKLLPAGQQMWPWLFNHQGDLDRDGELAVIVALVADHLAEYAHAASGRVLVAA